MPEDAGRDMKTRLRVDLRNAMKDGRMMEAKVIRALVAAIDNAETPPVPAAQTIPIRHRFHARSAEVERLMLSRFHIRRILTAELYDRERAAAEMERLEMMDRAETLRVEALLVKRYLD